ncbi:hypothetical protein G6F70_003870 [Rhizopus microsporus]|nr:hypothetical protein G6F71_003869 [Rhizopus microsporus]KAG1200630.1 hypothetical protein G6F70_003870 [Rhizopus microsporus]KAG1216432.1 hypothetical protein G6F69_000003 [Rhizopus microsporus]KAG1234409.1 hypothetical protein G6F67_003535 [Rhizopus microsporus]KAG1266680.1 hypothetical protein G6F68_002562 [Rhizopus microsporus]
MSDALVDTVPDCLINSENEGTSESYSPSLDDEDYNNYEVTTEDEEGAEQKKNDEVSKDEEEDCASQGTGSFVDAEDYIVHTPSAEFQAELSQGALQHQQEPNITLAQDMESNETSSLVLDENAEQTAVAQITANTISLTQDVFNVPETLPSATPTQISSPALPPLPPSPDLQQGEEETTENHKRTVELRIATGLPEEVSTDAETETVAESSSLLTNRSNSSSLASSGKGNGPDPASDPMDHVGEHVLVGPSQSKDSPASSKEKPRNDSHSTPHKELLKPEGPEIPLSLPKKSQEPSSEAAMSGPSGSVDPETSKTDVVESVITPSDAAQSESVTPEGTLSTMEGSDMPSPDMEEPGISPLSTGESETSPSDAEEPKTPFSRTGIQEVVPSNATETEAVRSDVEESEESLSNELSLAGLIDVVDTTDPEALQSESLESLVADPAKSETSLSEVSTIRTSRSELSLHEVSQMQPAIEEEPQLEITVQENPRPQAPTPEAPWAELVLQEISLSQATTLQASQSGTLTEESPEELAQDEPREPDEEDPEQEAQPLDLSEPFFEEDTEPQQAQSLLYKSNISPSMLSPPMDYVENCDRLVKELVEDMQRCIQENSDVLFNAPSIQSNSHRRKAPSMEARFISMDEILHQDDYRYFNFDDLESHKPMTDEERAIFEAMTEEEKREAKRLNIIDELVETEESYSRDLFILCNHFFKIIKRVRYINQEDFDALSRNLTSLAREQEMFCEAIKIAVNKDRKEMSITNLSNCFILWKEYFNAYFEYSIGQDKAVQVYKRLLKTSTEFRDLDERLHTFHRVVWGTNKLKFEDYMIMPFQRLFRYKLLLQTLQKATPKDFHGFDRITVAEDVIHRVAKKINDTKARIELEQKTELFLSRLQGHWCLPKRWFTHLGCCSLIGTLEVRCLPKQRSSKRVCCALFSHYLIMVKAKKTDIYEAKHWFPIRKFSVENMPDDPASLHFPWLLRSGRHTFEFSAASEAEKDMWTETMKDCIKRAKKDYEQTQKNPRSPVEQSQQNPDTHPNHNFKEYVEEQLFVSSLDQRIKGVIIEEPQDIGSSQPFHIPMPSGSASFSQSAIFSKPERNNNRLSIPNFSSIFHSDGIRSPNSGKFAFTSSLRERLADYKLKQFKARCEAFDANFRDVYVTSLVTAKGSHKKKNANNNSSNNTQH